jgi:hypothetical protein
MDPARARAGSIDFLQRLSKPAAGSGPNTWSKGGIVLPFTGYPALRWQAFVFEGAEASGDAHRREVWRYLLDVLLVTNADDFEAALPKLQTFAQSTDHAPLSDQLNGHRQGADVAIIDARTDLAAARRVCRRLTANAPALAVVAVVAPSDFAAVDVEWHFDDVLLPAAGPVELQARLRMAITRPVVPDRWQARIWA